MPELTDAQINELLAKGLGRPAAVEGKPSPLAGEPTLPVVARQEGYDPATKSFIVNIPGTTSANAPAQPAPAGTPVLATPSTTPPGAAPATGEARPVVVYGEGPEGKRYELTQAEAAKYYAAKTPATQAKVLESVPQAPVVPPAGPIVTPPMVAATPTGPKPSEGISDLDTVMAGVWNTETGNRQINPKTGKIFTSPTGNLGVSQLGVATAKELGVDPYNEDQNREGGKRYLSQMFDKYGNWRDATGAYFAGPGAYDKWLAAGSPRDSKIGAQITKYQDTALANAGILERGATAAKAPDGSRLLSDTDIHSLMTQVPPQTPEEAARRTAKDDGILSSIMDASKATTYSLYKGARDFELGMVQAGLEQVAPDTAKALTARVNEVDAPWKPLLDKHPVLSTVGEITGSVGAMFGAARLLGPPVAALGQASGMATVAREIAPKVPWLLRESGALTTLGRYGAAAPAGAAITAGTAFNPSGNPSDRVSEAVLGAIAGPLGVAFGHGVSKAMSLASTRGELGRMMSDLKANGDILSGDLNYLKNVAIDRVSQVEQEATRRYGIATATGKATRGLDAKTLDDVIQAHKTLAASEIDTTKSALRREMGLDVEAARAAASAVQHQQYADHLKAVGAAQDAYVDRALTKAGIDPKNTAIHTQYKQNMLATYPDFPSPTMPAPAPYVPTPISADQFMKGRQLLQREARRTTSRAKRQQIGRLRSELDGEFSQAAQAAGMSASTFYRRLLSADKFYKGQVVPAHDLFQGWFGPRFRGSEKLRTDAGNVLTSGVDPTKVFERVVRTVESGTQREVDGLLHVFGSTPRDKEKLVQSLAYRALTKSQGGIGKDFDPAAVAKYIDENHTNLSRVLTSEQYKWMQGFAKVVETTVEAAKSGEKAGARKFWRGSNFLLIIGAEHMFRGDFLHGAELIASGMAAHTLFHSVPALRSTPVLNRLVRNAADLRPGSEELNRLAAQIEWQYAKRAAVTARYAGEKMNAAPTGPRFAPLSGPPPQSNVPLPH